MKDLAIYGGGGLGKELATMIPIVDPKGERWHFLGYFDDVKATGSKVSHFGTVLGGVEALNNWSTPSSTSSLASVLPQAAKLSEKRLRTHW